MVTRAFSDEVAQGSVISTDPGAGTERRPGSAVALVVSKGSPVDVPDVTGDVRRGRDRRAGGRGPEGRRSPPSGSTPRGRGHGRPAVAGRGRQRPGRHRHADHLQGPGMIEVPDVVGDNVDEATARAGGGGLRGQGGPRFPFLGDTVESQSVDGAASRPPRAARITIKTKGLVVLHAQSRRRPCPRGRRPRRHRPRLRP